ncbi:MAG: hypothetical protein ABI282_08180 [Candidatus Baltobacteraceae bacterium]
MLTEKTLRRRYFTGLFGSMIAYAIALVAVNLIAARLGSGHTSLLVILSLVPMVPIAFAVAAIVRFMNDCDELERMIQLNSLAIAFATTAFASLSYGFLEGVGFPRPSMFVVWPFMAMVWLAASLVMRLRYR